MSRYFFINVIKGSVLSIIITVFLSLIEAAVSTYYLLGINLLAFLSILITSVSIFIGAAYSSRNGRKHGYLAGLLVAVIYMAFIFLFSKINGNAIAFDISAVMRIILAVIIGMLSGMLGINI